MPRQTCLPCSIPANIERDFLCSCFVKENSLDQINFVIIYVDQLIVLTRCLNEQLR